MKQLILENCAEVLREANNKLVGREAVARKLLTLITKLSLSTYVRKEPPVI